MKEIAKKTPINFRPLVNFLVFALMVAGMGFSGFLIGGSVGRKNETPVYLSVVSVAPETNSMLSAGDTVSVQFGSSLKRSSLSRNNFFAIDIRNEKIVPMNYVYNDATRTLHFSFPDHLFSKNTEIQVELTDQMTDMRDCRMKEGRRLYYSIVKKPEPPRHPKKSGAKKARASAAVSVPASKAQKSRL